MESVQCHVHRNLASEDDRRWRPDCTAADGGVLSEAGCAVRAAANRGCGGALVKVGAVGAGARAQGVRIWVAAAGGTRKLCRAGRRRLPEAAGIQHRRMLCAVAVVAASMLPVAAGGHQHWKSGHYKSATLSWERVGGDKSRTVDITLRASWSTEFSAFQEQVDGGVIQPGQEIRLMGLGNPVLFFGDGAESYAMLNAKVIAVDPVVQAWRGEATVRHTYPAHANYTAHIGGCCRDPHVRNSERGYFQIATGVHLASNGSRSPQVAVLARQYVRAGWLDAHANGFVIAAFDSGLHPNQAAMGRVSGLKFGWSRVDARHVAGVADAAPHSIGPSGLRPEMAGDAACCNTTQAVNRGMLLDAKTGRMYGVADEGLYYALVAVVDNETGVYTQVDFEVAVVPYNATMPEFEGNFSQAILDLPAVNEVYATYSYEYRVRFLVPGALPLSVRLEYGTMGSLLPPTASLAAQAHVTNVGGYKAYESALAWAVAVADVGWHVVCLQAYANTSVPGFPAVASRTHCLEFDVMLDPPPRFSSPPAARTSKSVFMGEELVLDLVVTDDNLHDTLTIHAHDLPEGAVVSEARKDRSVQSNTVRQTMTWVPPAHAGGETGSFCFTAADVRGSEGGPGGGSAEVCFDYQVPKCMYRVRAGEALVDVAEHFRISWLQLWSLNKDIRRPEGHGQPGSVQEGYLIHIGQQVQVRSGDTLEKLAARFGTTLRQVLNLNQDLAKSKALTAGQHVCLVPSSCMERHGF